MKIETRTAHGIAQVDINSRLFARRQIFLQGDITQEMADEFGKQMFYLMSEDSTKPIYVFINSYGGSYRAGMKMIDYLSAYKKNVFVICDGVAFSMAAVVYASCEEKHRWMTQSAAIMIHEPYIEEITGSSTQMHSIAERLSKVNDTICEIIAAHTKMPSDEIRKYLKEEKYFDANQAMKKGLADRIISVSELVF